MLNRGFEFQSDITCPPQRMTIATSKYKPTMRQMVTGGFQRTHPRLGRHAIQTSTANVKATIPTTVMPAGLMAKSHPCPSNCGRRASLALS